MKPLQLAINIKKTYSEEEEAFWRSLIVPVEDKPPHALQWAGGYRWFRSPNVVCLEKYRQLKASGRI